MTLVRKFALPNGATFSIPEVWWLEAGMARFMKSQLAYPASFDERTVREVRLSEIEPPSMERRQHLDFGGFDRGRMVAVLSGIAQGSKLPPIETVERPVSRYRFKLCNGTHRFYASVAAGFSEIPTALGWIPETLNMFTTPEDWIERFREAGCKITLDAITMHPVGSSIGTPCEGLWAEIRGSENRQRWDLVEALVRLRVGPFHGWADF